ncbi:MAG: metallophosphoesterase [Phycisphaerae bacterium]
MISRTRLVVALAVAVVAGCFLWLATAGGPATAGRPVAGDGAAGAQDGPAGAASRGSDAASREAGQAGACTWSGVQRIVAVGDVHGDYAQFIKVLRAASVVNDKDDWIAGRTHLVQTGDVVDKGPASRKCMDLLMKLEKQAADAGGAVHALIGNHEALVLLGDWRYVAAGEIDAFGGKKEYRQAMSAAGKYGRWIRSHDAAIKINDIVFVHGGITAAYAGKSLAQINKAVRDELASGQGGGIAMDPDGPLWDRSLALEDERLVAGDVEKVLKAYGAKHMVIGHTDDTSGVTTRAGERIIKIDVGMSSIYRGPAACLIVENGVFHEARHNKEKRKLFGEPARPQPATGPPIPATLPRPIAPISRAEISNIEQAISNIEVECEAHLQFDIRYCLFDIRDFLQARPRSPSPARCR